MSNLNMPLIRFTQYSDSWKLRPLSELIASVDSGWSPQCDDGTASMGEWGVLKTTSIQWTGFEPKQNKKLPNALEPRAKLSLSKNDILVTRAGPNERVGVVSIVNQDYPMLMLSDKIIRLRANAEVDPSYLALNLSLKKSNYQIMRKASGLATSQTNISQGFLLQTKLNVPELPEQQKIASFLSKVDEKIALLTEKKDKFTEYKKGVMQQLFNGKWEEQDGQLTFIPPTLRFKADDGSEFPDWEEKKLGDLFSISAGGDISKEHSNSVKTDKFKYPVFANAETNKGLHSYSDIYKISQPCLTVSGRGSLGNAVFRDEPFYPIVRLLVLKAALPVDLKFYEYAINKLNIFNESTGVPQLTAPQLRTYAIVMPCIEEQKKIARAIESLDRKIDLVLLELEKAKEWKKGLLQQMFV
ncbi:restriction endonuclease subunit S [Vibrio parahaemolyticus]|uniref:restriction endonuclease subunit S n=1 Tax=Vibrio parahaemolyticus TaxID=670 RepID=UPI00225C37CD|nr:restriction endonuclease subunit S [Vibrio parahaemolyticus]MCX4121525.1 restriction endonuclease subunit S [Vibrio parahaemolyticus]